MSSRFLTQALQNYSDTLATVACALLILIGWLFLQWNWINVALLIFPIAYVLGGYKSTLEGLTTLWQNKELDVDLLMIVAALGAAGLGLWQREYFLIVDGAILILIFSISGLLEDMAMSRTESSIRALMSLTPDKARVMLPEGEQEIPIEQVQIGNLVLVKPGENIPVDGVIIEGESIVNQAPITGESLPVDKSIGDEVFAGTINGHGFLRLKVNHPPEGSIIQRVIRLVAQAQNEAPPSQQFIEKFEKGYARVIVILGLALGILPPFLLGWDWETTIYRALIFLVVASPCALMASIMPTLLSGIANGARKGILFKNGAQLEKIGQVRAIAFDKTGTLTTGKLKVTDIIPICCQSVEHVLQLAASLETCSEHPIGEAIIEAATQQKISWKPAIKVQAQAGRGMVGYIEDKPVYIGKKAFIQAEVPHISPELIAANDALESDGKTVIWVVKEKAVFGMIAMADTIRPESKQLINSLKAQGIEEIVMLTGDNQKTAQSVGKSLGILTVYADLLPEEKLVIVQQLRHKYQTVAMVGDGINDAPALATASVGVAVATKRNDIAIETADIILMNNNVEKLSDAIALGRRANLIVKQNITFALSFIFLLLMANFLGNINMPLGVIGHEGSTVIVTLSGLRLLRG